MYYQNGNYMQDLNYYNQNPNQNFNYPYVPNYQNQTMGRNAQNQNLNAMYPAVYRIILPVVMQVLSNNNYGYITEDSLNNMVDNVYDIVESDVNLTRNSKTSQQTNQNNSSSDRNSNMSSQNSNNSSNSSEQNLLLKDLIKIMILNEIAYRRAHNQMFYNNMNQGMYM